ncbi:MAG: undecaprenyldiphospho-muramoylpentapeptide beta-N-acetylglucosaminyltransferase [Syntrophaceae bacterium]|nr:undecaprenyldiphospho-muramoylpentapeptide beta-N-acetylglucosaminyltransferase [Syntrophaceae bacterium]
MRLLIAGGGTGGHLFPALAIARAFRSEHPDGKVLFVGVKKGIEARIIPQTEFSIRFIDSKGMLGKGFFNKIKALFTIPVGLYQSVKIIKDYRPDFVLGVGGYASGPTLAAATFLGAPTGIQEQNSLMGLTNKLLSRVVNKIFISWEKTTPPTDPLKTLLVGNPIREELLTALPDNGSDKFKILIFGGSLGARSINQAMISGVHDLRDHKGKISIRHQTGMGAADEVRKAYTELGIDAEVFEFIDDIGPHYKWADLVVSRSGASTLAELTALGKPAILVPYPFAIKDHQLYNAKFLEARGAARIVLDSELSSGILVKSIIELMAQQETLEKMALNSRKLGRPQAARTIAREILKLKRKSN